MRPTDDHHPIFVIGIDGGNMEKRRATGDCERSTAATVAPDEETGAFVEILGTAGNGKGTRPCLADGCRVACANKVMREG